MNYIWDGTAMQKKQKLCQHLIASLHSGYLGIWFPGYTYISNNGIIEGSLRFAALREKTNKLVFRCKHLISDMI